MTIIRIMNRHYQIPAPTHMRDMIGVGGFLFKRVSNEWIHGARHGDI